MKHINSQSRFSIPSFENNCYIYYLFFCHQTKLEILFIKEVKYIRQPLRCWPATRETGPTTVEQTGHPKSLS